MEACSNISIIIIIIKIMEQVYYNNEKCKLLEEFGGNIGIFDNITA